MAMPAEPLEREMAAAAGRRPLLLLGPPGSGRSALLFRAALTAASTASSARVLFLAPRPLERLPGGKAAAGGAVQRIRFLYPPSSRELLPLLASLHRTLPGGPSMMALDDLQEYLGGCPGGARAAAQCVALLLDTANHFAQRRSHLPGGCQLIVSMRFLGEAGEEAERFSAIERYFPAKLWLYPDSGKDGGLDSQSLSRLVRAQLLQPGTKDQEWRVKFDAQGTLTTSPLPGKNETENETLSENGPPDSEVNTAVTGSQT